MKSVRNFMRRSLALLLTLALMIPTCSLAAGSDGENVITGEPTSIEADEAGIPRMLSDDASVSTVNYSVTYNQTNARSILEMVNNFRQSSDAWYWNEDNKTKTELTETLSNYTYDYDLEKVAMQRAAEIAIYYSHTRPDGETCWTAYSDMNYSCNAKAENIAAGYATAEAVFEGWREDDDNYEGQGHRRNMLSSNYTAIGIGCVKYNGYCYWVQEFSNVVNNSSSTSANDSETKVSAEVANDGVSSSSLSASPSSYALSIGGTDTLPVISGTVKLTETWPSSVSCSLTGVDTAWSSADNGIASVSGDTVTGVKSGETTLTADALGQSFSVPVSVAMISGATITLSNDSYTYDGSAKEPTVTVKFGSSTLTKDTDYTVSYSNNTNAGTATVTVTGKGNYEGSQTVNFTINKASQTLTASLAASSITIGNTTSITASGDGTISYKSSDTGVATVDDKGVVTGVGAGTATITVTAAGNDNYESASAELNIEVKKADQTLIVSIDSNSIKAGEKAMISATALDKAEISYVSGNDKVATVDSGGIVTGVGVGTVTITVTADETDNYGSASATIDITVTKGEQNLTASIESSSIKTDETTKITVAALGEAEISYVSDNDKVATVDSDGTVTGVGVGNATITITANETDNYGSASKTIEITVTKGDQKLTASLANSSILVGGTTTITASAEGDISYETSDSSIATVGEDGKVTGVGKGTATINVTAEETENYESASKKLSITVKKADQTLTAKAKSSTIVVGKATTITASGKGTITYSSGNTKIATVNSSGKVTAKSPGKVTITVTAAGNNTYNSASKKVTIKVNPKAAKISSVKNSASKKATVKWKKISDVTGYQIQYSTNKSFKSGNKSTTVKGASKVSKTLSKLKKGKTYYVRIRTYKTVSGTKYYSSWSSAKKVKIKK